MKRTQTNSSVGGWERTGSPNPGGTPKYTRQEQGSQHRGQWIGSLKERYSNTKVTVEHNTVGKGGKRAEIKKRSQVGSALSSPGSPGVWGWFRAAGQVSVELLGQWAVGVGRGRAGRSQGEVGTDRGSGRWGYTYHSFLEMKDPSF